MESVGQKLRDARLRMRLALNDVSAATKINLRNLQAIEADDLDQICSPFTYRSFARQYAKFVGLDSAELDTALAEMSNRIPAPLIPGEAGAPLPASSRPRKKSNLRGALSLTSLAVILVACSVVYSAWQTRRSTVRGSVTAFVNALSVHATRKPQAAATSAQVSDANGPKNFRIELSALEECWLSVVADGREVFSGVLQPSQTKVLDGQEEARIRTGNAGGVMVNFNGRSLGTLGKRGEVRTVIFNRDGYEILDHSAHLATVSYIQ